MSATASTARVRRFYGAMRSILVLALLLLPVEALAVDRVGGVEVVSGQTSIIAVPDVTMAAGILVTDDGRELWARNAEETRAMASTTKIMTAIVVLENLDPDAWVDVSSNAASTGESAAGLTSGDRLTVREALEAMLVKSGNDAAVALAEQTAGGESAFVEMMNEKAAQLGLDDTHFTNPHGLDATEHYTTASDLATLSRYAMGFDEFRRIVGLEETIVHVNGGTRTLPNSNELIASYPGATGVKTGWTNRAGYCLAAAAEREGIGLTAIVLGTGSEDQRFIEARRLLDWGFEHYTVRAIASRDESVGVVAVADYLDRSVLAVVGEAAEIPVFDGDGDVLARVDLEPELDAPVERGDRVGTLTVTQGELLLAQIPVISAYDVEAPSPLERVGIWFARAWRFIFGGDMIAQTEVSY